MKALAMHFIRGHDLDRAVSCGKVAAEQALERHAYPEAIDHLNNALNALGQLPQATGRDQKELELRLLLSPTLVAAVGYAHPDVVQQVTRAQELCERLEDTSHMATALWHLASYWMARARLAESRSIVEKFVETVETGTDSDRILMGHSAIAQLFFSNVRSHRPESTATRSFPGKTPSGIGISPVPTTRKTPA